MNWYWPGFCRAPFFPFFLFFLFFPPPGAVEYAIDYTTDRRGREGSRCLRLIPIPRNRRSTSHVRFNIFDGYLVPRLFPLPSCVTVHTHTYRLELSSPRCWLRIFDRRPRRSLFQTGISKSSPRAVYLSLFIFWKKRWAASKRGGVDLRKMMMEMERWR